LIMPGLEMFDLINPMTKAEAREWVEALRSGNYEQGTGRLRNEGRDSTGRWITAFCCLGVEREVHPDKCQGVNSTGALLNSPERRAYRLPEDIQDDLIDLNDTDAQPFAKIADYIEINIIPELAD